MQLNIVWATRKRKVFQSCLNVTFLVPWEANYRLKEWGQKTPSHRALGVYQNNWFENLECSQQKLTGNNLLQVVSYLQTIILHYKNQSTTVSHGSQCRILDV